MKILVSAASRHGATAEIAEAIARTLTAEGHEAAVLPPEQVTTTTAYDAFVLGSGVYMGRWLEPARRLVDRAADTLERRPVWLFSSGPMGDPPKPEGDPADLAALREKTAAREHRVFSGRIDRARLGLGERAIVRAVRAPEGDFRPWAEIEAWAREIAETLDGTSGRPA